MDPESLARQLADANETLLDQRLLLPGASGVSALDTRRQLVFGHPDYGLTTIPLDARMAPPDFSTHVVLYRAFPEIGAVVQTQSHFATCWAQAHKPIPCLGALHASHFLGEIPVTAPLTEVEVEGDLEYHLGKAVSRCFTGRDPLACPAVLLAGVGAIVWGVTLSKAVEHARVLEEVAGLAWNTLALNPVAQPLEHFAQERYFYRRHTPALRRRD